MAEPSHDELAQETYKLARDNNHMLHAMRRNAFIGGIVKIITWIVLFGLPIWFFITYLNPTLNNAVSTMNQVQGQVQGAKGAGSSSLNNLIEQIKKIPGFGNFGG